jgi:hypothetical protein
MDKKLCHTSYSINRELLDKFEMMESINSTCSGSFSVRFNDLADFKMEV